MDKHFQLHGKTAEGRPLIHLVEPSTGYGLGTSAGLDKVASGEHLPEVLELIESIQPQPGRLYLVNSALGAGEFVGFNLRGDWFTERGLLHTPPGWDTIPVWDIEGRRRAASTTETVKDWGSLAWGYPTFYNAHRFRHHVNKDPERAYGYILGAFWDARMRRVVLVSELVRDLCVRLGAVDLYDRIAAGEFPDTSMGAKVPYDRCSICNHYARSPEHYCEHVVRGALPPFGMRAILPDGRMCGVYNDYPRFFDDSYVFIGAERSAKVMANVTSRVRGNRPYTERLFAPGGIGLSTREVSADAPLLPLDERHARLGNAVANVLNSRVRGPAESRVGANIASVLSALPAARSDAEAKAMEHAQETLRRRAGVRDRTITDEEQRFWEGRSGQDLHAASVTPAQQDRAIALLTSRMNALPVGEKLGSLAKWAELVKRIPAPSEHQRALLRDHMGRLVPVLPREIYDECGAGPSSMHDMLSHLGALGVVLRPEEFQYCSLSSMGQSARAQELAAEGSCFERTPLDPYHEPRWLPGALRGDTISRLVSALGPVLLGRSFAPRAVAIRITMCPAPQDGGVSTLLSDPLLDQISQQYNDYRTGLMTRPPDWSYVPAMSRSATLFSDKTADAPNLISSLLLHLAYW